MINESLNNIDEVLHKIETNNSQVINKINYNSDNLNIPLFLNSTTSESNAHKFTIAKEDIDLYNQKYKELSEKTNEYTQNTFESIKEIIQPVNNLKNELDKMSDNFEETMKNLCLPFILEQKGLINTSESNLRRLDLYEKMTDYKSEITELNLLYNKFLNYIILIIDTVVSAVDEISNSANELNDYINEGIINFTNLVENTDTNNLHNNLITMKDSFLKLKDDINERKNNLEENINSFQKLYEKMRNELQDFQNDFNKLTENINEISNLIVEEVTKENEIEIEKQSSTDFIVDSILNSLSFIYESVIKFEIQTKERLISIIIVINVESKTSLDMLFIMDLTGSMEPYINETKTNLIDIMDKIIDQSPGIDINLGFIGYRDIPAEGGGEYIDIDFTQNHNHLREQINNVYADLGGDLPEDVAWAFEMALNKTWKSNAKFIVFVADAPGHGLKYYKYDKKYPDEIEGRKDIEESVIELVKNNVCMFCLEITDYTKQMFNIFQNVYNKYGSCNLEIVNNNGNNFSDEIVDSAIQIYSTQRKTEDK